MGRRAGFPGARVAGIDALAGATIALAQAPLLAWYLAFPGLVWAMARMARPATAAGGWWAGWFVGAGYFAASLNWIVSPFFVDPWTHGWMAPFALVLMAFGLGLFWAAAAALALWVPQRLLGLAALLAAAELLRGHVLTGFPWAQLGHIWLGSPAEQLAAVIGAPGLAVLTPVLAVLPLIWPRRGAVAAAVLVALALVFGVVRLGAAEPAPRDLTLRLVQPAAAQHLKWDPALARSLFQRLLDLTSEDPPADLTIWPETAVPYILEYSPEVAGMIAAVGQGAPVALGIQRTEGDRGWNSLRVIQPDARIAATYDKHHLVPFGEYMPLGDLMFRLFGIGAFAAQVGNGYSAGSGPAVLDLGPVIGRVLPLICYEAVFPDIPRKAPLRPDWMVQITNDAWFGTLTGPFQHFQQSRLRAIEMGLPLIRVGNTGVTAVIDARGRVQARLPFGQPAALVVPSVPGALPPTPFARAGNLPALLLLAGVVLMAIRRGRAAPP